MWEQNAKYVEDVFGSFVDWEVRFYICPSCGEPIYDVDWDESELHDYICPVCEFYD